MQTTSSTGIDNGRIQASWDAVADGFDQFVTDLNTSIGREGLRRAGLRPGDSFLDVAAGSGALSLPAAQIGARVTATDISPRMVERLAARAGREGLHDLKALVMDGCALEFEDDSFDVAGSQYGVMLFPDLPLGLAEMVRVTRPGGKVLVIAFGPPSQVEFISFFLRAIKAAVPEFKGIPSDPPPPEFQLADPNRFRARLIEAGLTDVELETVSASFEFESGAQAWRAVTNSNPIAANIVGSLSPQQRSEAEQALDRQIRERAGGNRSAVLSHPVHIGVGRVV